MWQYYGIGDGKEFNIGKEPLSPKWETITSFKDAHLSTGKVLLSGAKKKEVVYCSEPMCVKSFTSVDRMLKHLDYGKHEFQATASS